MLVLVSAGITHQKGISSPVRIWLKARLLDNGKLFNAHDNPRPIPLPNVHGTRKCPVQNGNTKFNASLFEQIVSAPTPAVPKVWKSA
jgi:hypothetical protein